MVLVSSPIVIMLRMLELDAPAKFLKTVFMEMFVWWVATAIGKVELKCALTTGGEQSVTTSGMTWMLLWFADNLDM